jgi:hypothetical protein
MLSVLNHQISVVSHERLNVYKLNNYNNNLLDELSLDSEELDFYANDINNNNNANYKFIKIKVTNMDGTFIYPLVHGFPGDAPVGYILLSNGLYDSVGNTQSAIFHVKLIAECYKIIKNNEFDYDHDFWY